MTDEDLQEFNSAKRMTAIITTNDRIFESNAKALALKDTLNVDITVLETTGAAGVSGRGRQTAGTADKKATEAALEVFLRKIAADAKMIKKAEPNFDNQFKLPVAGFSAQRLLDTARSYIESLTAPIVVKFGEYGATSVTPENIQLKIDQIGEASVQQNTGRNESIGATAGTKAAISRLKTNRRLLKSIGENIIGEIGDAGLLAEWKSACRLERKKSKGDAEPTPAP